MPTGYTCDIASGKKRVTLADFAKSCSRAITPVGLYLRDRSFSDPLPEAIIPNTEHYDKQLKQLIDERQKIYNMTNAELNLKVKEEIEENKQYRAKKVEETLARRQRYEDMINKVEAWEHAPIGLKDFMLQQLHTGLDFDCPEDILRYYPEVKHKSGEDWKFERLQSIAKNIEYYTSEKAKELARIESANQWLNQLNEALVGVE